ncbi:glycosyltransferase [Telluribacter sp.]|jgi:glycosyltransferase involved in cell wall biosynthesis|uniref:glycosyltransferase n=1 Tax=Telluribacter sp. TaxID=1978767 RepID=UPI002E13F4EE|nr:glycosyltransferase [Telluribacter sp.]
MRILNICSYSWAIGGPARTIFDNTTQALQQGHQVDILSPITPGDKAYPVPPGARLFECKRTPGVSKVFREFSIELYHFLKMHIHEYDIIHIHGIWHFGSLAPFLTSNKVPKVFTIHGLLDTWALKHSQWKKQLVTFLFQKKLLGKAALIHVLNTDEEADVIQYLGYRPGNLVVIPNGMKISDYTDLPPKGTFRTQFGISANKKLVLFMSRLNIKKGLDLLLPAFQRYSLKHPDTVLVLAGPDDGYQEKAEAFIKENQLESGIKLVGMLTDKIKKAALADADLFVLPSYSEGFSIAVLEAMAARVPTLVSERVGFGEYLKKYDAACLTPLTVEGVEQGLLQTLSNSQYRLEIADRAFTMVNKHFDIQVVAKQLLDEYQKISPAQ